MGRLAAILSSMFQKSWVCLFGLFEGVHREVVFQRLLLKVISVAKAAALVSFGKTPFILALLFTSRKNRSRMLVVRTLAWWFPG